MPLSALESSFWCLVPYVKVGIIWRPCLPPLVLLYNVYGARTEVFDLMVKCSNLTKFLGTDLACVLPYRLCHTLIMLLWAFNCFALSSFFCSLQVFHCVHFECPAQNSTHKDESSKEVATTEVGTGGQQLVSRPVRAASTSSLHSPPGSTSRSHAHQP